MSLSLRLARLSSAAILGCLVLVQGSSIEGECDQAIDVKPPTTTARANDLIRRQPGFFVPNQGQWNHPGKYVHRSGPMTLFLRDRGWVVDLVERSARPKSKQASSSKPRFLAAPTHNDSALSTLSRLDSRRVSVVPGMTS